MKILAIQDGGQFYNELTGDLILDFGNISEADLGAATKARETFLRMRGEEFTLTRPISETAA